MHSMEPFFFILEDDLIDVLIREFNIETSSSTSNDEYLDSLDVFNTIRDGLRSGGIKHEAFMRFLACQTHKIGIDVLSADSLLPAFIAACHYYFGHVCI